MAKYCSNCEKFASLTEDGYCKDCGKHAEKMVDLSTDESPSIGDTLMDMAKIIHNNAIDNVLELISKRYPEEEFLYKGDNYAINNELRILFALIVKLKL